MKRPVTVAIAGSKYTLRSDLEDAAVKALAAFVDARFKEVQRTSRAPDTQSIAILTALRIAEELFDQRAETGELKRKVREKSQALLQFLERQGGV
jgi:cell division protein ZapA